MYYPRPVARPGTCPPHARRRQRSEVRPLPGADDGATQGGQPHPSRPVRRRSQPDLQRRTTPASRPVGAGEPKCGAVALVRLLLTLTGGRDSEGDREDTRTVPRFLCAPGVLWGRTI